MGRLMYQISRWKLEKGATMGTLEQLMGSRTIGSTLLTQFQLRSFNILSVSLILVWAFSPFGGQSFLRMLGLRLQTVTEPSSIVYFDNDAESLFGQWDMSGRVGSGVVPGYVVLLDSLYVAALISPDTIKNDTMDLWGNVKIPFLTSYGDSDSPDWQQVPSVSDMKYSALAGIPINNVSMGNSTFNIESSYINLECRDIMYTGFEKPTFREIQLNDTGVYPLSTSAEIIVPNGTWRGIPANDSFRPREDYQMATWTLGLDRFIDPLWHNYSFMSEHGLDNTHKSRPALFENETDIEAGPTKLLFQVSLYTNVDRPPDRVKAECGVFQNYIESRVHCSRRSASARQNCTVIEQRRSQKPHAPENISPLSFIYVFYYLSRGLPRATKHETMFAQADPSLQYIHNPTDMTLELGGSYLAFQNMSEEVFSTRLSQLINSYILLSQVFTDIPGGSTDPQVWFEPNITVEVEVDSLLEVYWISRPWVAGCIISCIVLLVGGILSGVFVYLSDGPEVLGYVSTAIRDSKYMEVPPGAGRTDGIELTNQMKDQRVRYGVTHLTHQGKSLFGIGSQDDIVSIKVR